MADGDGLPPDRKEKKSAKKKSHNEAEAEGKVVELDLGDDNLRKHDNYRLGNQNIGAGTSSGDCSRREDNPFSFKHFLRSDSSYQNKGARPKVYCDGRPVASVLETHCGQLNENPSALPDFVQDHLVIEQSYASNGPTCNYNIGVQLPDFAQNSLGCRQNNESHVVINNALDGSDISGPFRPQAEFPLDLPVNSGRRGSSNEVAVSKSLPDFLNDGAVRSQNADSQSPDTPERLQRELDLVRRQLTEETNRADLLKRELEEMTALKNRILEGLEYTEKNYKKSNKKLSTAEATIVYLQQEIVTLQKELKTLRGGNSTWHTMEGASGGPSHQSSSNHPQTLALELRNAASTAESSLRQLLSGVDNLRLMASKLENLHRKEENFDPYQDSDENSGPAL